MRSREQGDVRPLCHLYMSIRLDILLDNLGASLKNAIFNLNDRVEICYKVMAIGGPSMLLLTMVVVRPTLCFNSFGLTLVGTK